MQICSLKGPPTCPFSFLEQIKTLGKSWENIYEESDFRAELLKRTGRMMWVMGINLDTGFLMPLVATVSLSWLTPASVCCDHISCSLSNLSLCLNRIIPKHDEVLKNILIITSFVLLSMVFILFSWNVQPNVEKTMKKKNICALLLK